jgi:stage V sporulation protein B
VGGVSIGVVIYVFVVLLTKTVTKEDILMVPGGEKFAKLLEKRSLLG